jgi:hypothetical protein
MPYTLEEALALDRLPGHTKWESALLQAWLAMAGGVWESFDFNVRLGGGVDPGPAFAPSIRAGSIANTQPRADCIATKGLSAAIVEVKIVGYLGSLGQILAYEQLYRHDHPELLRVDRILVAHHLAAEVARVLTSNHVTIVVFPAIGPPA